MKRSQMRIFTAEAAGLLQEVESQKSETDLRALVGDVTRRLGYQSYTICDMAGTERRLAISSFREDWLESYFAYGYQDHDPVLRTMARAPSNFAWDRRFFERRRMMTAASDSMFADAEKHGLGRGQSLFLDRFAGGAVMVSAIAETLPEEAEAVFGLSYSIAYRRLHALAIAAARRSDRALSRRERECLVWVANGRTDPEIATILGLTSETVRSHVKNANRKLKARTRAEAVGKAIWLGFI